MLRGLYTAASGMLSTLVATDTLANNLANVSTVGYKNSKVNFQGFRDMMIQRMSAQGGNAQIGSVATGSKVQGTYVDYNPGAITKTGNTFDMAMEGDGFFTVKTANGDTNYTRAGNFTINEEGYITTVNGEFVQGKLGNILLNLDQGPFQINTKGEILARGKMIDQLKITRFADNQTLSKVGDNRYAASAVSDMLPEPADDQALGYTIHQGALEQSNVNPVTELVNNIQGMRLYEALQRNIGMHNETLGKAVNEVGRYR